MKKLIKRFVQVVVIVILVLFAVIFLIGKLENSAIRHIPSVTDYSDVIKLGVGSSNPRVVDIAMLGAHDTFSDKIKGNSPVDPGEHAGSMIRNKAVSFIASGLFARLLKAQYSSPEELFKRGVRYYDVRLSYYNDTWYTKHAVISDKLEGYLTDLLNCLNNNPGEFIIFDMQHVYLGDATFEDLFTYLGSVKTADGKSILDFIHYDASLLELSEMTYNDITAFGQKAAVIILAKWNKENSSYNNYYYEYNSSIRSTWHEKNDNDELLASIKDEYLNIYTNNLDKDKFRVNQAQLTGLYSMDKIAKTIKGWSLLNMAENFNALLIEEADLKKWFDAMPILMVDYADSTQNNFNTQINSLIINYNNKLHSGG